MRLGLRRATLFAAAFGVFFISFAPALAGVEEDIIVQMNRARAQPAAYAKEMREYWAKAVFTDKVYVLPGLRIRHITNEGRAAVDEAIAFLERQAPLPPIAPYARLAQAAADHAASQGMEGLTGHAGPDGSRPFDRIKRRGGDLSYTGEVIYYGATAQTSAADVVRSLIIDDGVADRGHRKVIFDPRFLSAGAGCGPHKVYGGICVANFGPRLKPGS